MVSHVHKCIFVHIPKTAGTSIEMSFLEELGLDKYNRHALLLGESNNSDCGPRVVSHLTAKEYVDYYFVSQSLFNEYYKFSVVRHPLKRLYSSYKFLGYADYISFETFVLYKLDGLMSSTKFGFFLKPQMEYLFRNGECIVDYIIRFESLQEDFDIIKSALDLPQLNLKHHNKTKRNISNPKRRLISVLKRIREWRILNFSKRISDRSLSVEAKKIVLRYYQCDYDAFDYDLDWHYD